MAQLLSTESQEDAEKITARMEYIDFITVTNLSINPIISATVDYVIFASEQTTLLGIATPAPGLSELLVTMDSDYYPHIFIGNTDKKADEARDFLKNTSSFKKLHDTVENALITALDSDPALKAAYENLISR